MATGDDEFPHRNGFARHADLQHPTLKRYLRLCRQEKEEFSGETHFDWSRQWEYPFVLANLPAEGSGRRILDAGSGYRFFVPMLARLGFDVDACDLDASLGPKYDEIAARYDVAIEFAQQDLARLTYADATFDYICCISVLEHTRDPAAIVREFERCLKPGGSLLLTFDVSVHGDRDIPLDAAKSLVGQLEEAFEPAQPFSGREYFDPDVLAEADEVLRTEWFRIYQPERLPWRFVSRAGLRNLLRGRIGRPFFDLAVVGMVLRKPAQSGGESS
jgi:SAM-dependent methyltransferase